MAINIALLGLAPLLSGALFASSGETPQIPRGELLPRAPIVLAFALVPLAAYVLRRTRFGLRLRAVGESPEAAAAAGISVRRVRYLAVALSGALAAIGGAYLSIGQSSLFSRNMSAGRGYIALAALVFGRWRPLPTMLACLLFGAAEALSIQMQGTVALPAQLVQIVPYLLTLAILAAFGLGSAGRLGRRAQPPKALGVPYEEGR